MSNRGLCRKCLTPACPLAAHAWCNFYIWDTEALCMCGTVYLLPHVITAGMIYVTLCSHSSPSHQELQLYYRVYLRCPILQTSDGNYCYCNPWTIWQGKGTNYIYCMDWRPVNNHNYLSKKTHWKHKMHFAKTFSLRFLDIAKEWG